MLGTRWTLVAALAALLLGSLTAADSAHGAEAVVDTARQAVIVAPTTARVVELAVGIGDHVEAGQMLVALDARRAESDLRMAELDFEMQRALVDALDLRVVAQTEAIARQNARVTRTRAAFEASVATPDVVEAAETALLQAQLELRLLELERIREVARRGQADESVQMARRALASTRIQAPFSGVIAALHCSVGDTLREDDSPVVTLMDLSPLTVVAEVATSEIAAWTPGRTVRVTARLGGHDVILLGRVERVAPVVTMEGQVVQVLVALKEKPPASLRPGLLVLADVQASAPAEE